MVRPDSGRRLSLAEEREIDRLCLAYEQEMRAGHTPEVESFLPADSQALWPRLRLELDLLREELSQTPSRPDSAPEGAPLQIGARIGGYELVGRLGEGGMGTVYEAVQERTRRHVALKVMRAGLEEGAARRFEREARLLGSLHHPGIAQLYDAGVHEAQDGADSVPYLVMELLHGRTLIEHANNAELDLSQRVELARRVCTAVQHAHEQGIVHRDLKPANIVVVDDWDDEQRIGLPKVLDFGVASAVGSPWLQTLETRAEQLVGTISHIAPEQVEDTAAADARSDVYSLGVVLYELLAGQLPHDLRGLSLAAAIARIREEEPAPLGRLEPRLSGDLEVIVGKALEKSPDARYASAAALGADLERHLQHRPIEARPPSAYARVAKFARRHRALVAGASVAVLALLGALVVVSLFAVRQARLRAEAEQDRRRAEAVSDFLDGLLSRANLGEAGNKRATTVYDALVAAAEEIEEAFADDPLSRAAVRKTIGKGFLSQGEAERALQQFEAALATLRAEGGPPDVELARAVSDVAQALEASGDYEAAATHFAAALELHEQLYPDDHPDLSAALNNMASILERRGAYEESIEMNERALAMRERLDGPHSLRVANSLNSLATVLETSGRLDEAEQAYRRALAIRDELLPPEHAQRLNVLHNLANLLIRDGRLDQSEDMHRELVRIREGTLDPDHPLLASSYASLGMIAYRRDDIEEALRQTRKGLEASERRLGHTHPDTLQVRINLAGMLGRAGDFEAQYALLSESEAPYLALHGQRSRSSLLLHESLARCLLARGESDRAEERIRHVLAIYAEDLPTHYGRAMAQCILADVLGRRGETANALGLLREAEQRFVEALGVEHPYTLHSRTLLARGLFDDGARAEGLELARSNRDAMDALGMSSGRYRNELEALLAEQDPASVDAAEQP